jgi:hypothetical protein
LSHGLPIWPIFCFVNGVGYAMAMFQNPDTVREYTPFEITMGGVTTTGFVVIGTMIWTSMTARSPKPPGRVVMIDDKHSVNFLMLFVALGVIFQLNQMVKLIPLPGNSTMVLRGVCLSLSSMGLFVLSFYAGRGMLTAGVRWYLALCGIFLISFGLTTLMLAQAAIPLAMVVIGLALGSNKMPWKVLAIAFVVMAILHPGKYPMREKYWGGGGEILTPDRVPAFFGEWAGYGLEEIGGFAGVLKTKSKDEDSASSAFERAGNLHMLLRVQKMSPEQVPFMGGITYAHIPRMLVPRFIDDQKGTSHVGNQILSVNYGLVEAENVNTVSIGWGLIPEAYANFGYIGVAGLAVLLASFYSFVTRLTVGVPLTSLRFVIGLLIMVAATTADTMGIFVSSQFQGIMAVSMASLVFMRRQINPFAAGEENTLPQREGAPEGRIDHRNRPNETRPAAAVRTPMRSAAWMPRSLRMRIIAGQREEAALAAQAAAAAPSSAAASEASQRPRQVAVPYRNYRRYRG